MKEKIYTVKINEGDDVIMLYNLNFDDYGTDEEIVILLKDYMEIRGAKMPEDYYAKIKEVIIKKYE